MTLLTERYRDKSEGVLSCYDRIIITGTLPQLCYAQGMTGYMYANRIRIFDYPRFAEPFRDQLRRNTERLAKENDINIEHVKKKKIKKEKLIQKVLEERGTAPGLVHIISGWNRVRAINPGTTRRNPARPISGPGAVSACIIISISLMKSLVFAMSGYRPGALFAFRSISTGIIGLPQS